MSLARRSSSQVAKRFGMPLQRLIDLNADLATVHPDQFATGER